MKGKQDERTEEEKVTRASLTVKLGGKEYNILPLVIKDSRVWRAKIIKLIGPLPQLVNISADDPESFQNALNQMMVVMPNQVVDLFFEYAKDLERDEIEGTATDDEMAVAFEEVVKIAFPLAGSLPQAMKRLFQ